MVLKTKIYLSTISSVPDESPGSASIGSNGSQVLDVVDIDVELFVGGDVRRQVWCLLGAPSEKHP